MSIYNGHKGIKEDRYGVRANVKVGGRPKVRRFPRGTPVKTIIEWQERMRVALREAKMPVSKDRLRVDAERYLAHMKAPGPDGKVPAGYAALCCEIQAWVHVFGELPRHKITREMVLDVLHRWRTEPRGGKGTTARVTKPLSPKTCNHRMRALGALYHYIDGPKAPTPCDEIDKLAVPTADPKAVPIATIKAVFARLTDPKTRARYMVLTASGQRPAQLKRATPEDVDFERRFWLVRAAKGGNAVPVYLTDDILVAFMAFAAADAWGDFDSSDYAKRLYDAGWPKSIRPYNAKHSVAIALGEAGADWEDIKDWFGHKDIKTTRIYAGHILRRTRNTAKHLEGRIGWADETPGYSPPSAGLVTETGNRQGQSRSQLVKNGRVLSRVKTDPIAPSLEQKPRKQA